jgi:4-hydroxybenzoate polyprenyltransferase
MSRLRTLLILGRVSNLPTVWSNCLAGWWLGGGGNLATLPYLFGGATLLYVGGMFLNDAFDVAFDRQHRPERPVPSGAISANAVWRWGCAWMVLGAGLLFGCGPMTGWLGLTLGSAVILYNALHKLTPWATGVMGLCRFLVYPLAASVGELGVTGWALWCGIALGVYVTGLSVLARRESTHERAPWWPLILLGAPLLGSMLMNVSIYRQPALLLSLIVAIWIVRCVRTTFWTSTPNVGRTVSGLLAGIVFVDWLAALEMPTELGLIFPVLFVATLSCQRIAPAT